MDVHRPKRAMLYAWTALSVSVQNKPDRQIPHTENVRSTHGHETRRPVLYLNNGGLPSHLPLAHYDRGRGIALWREFLVPLSNRIVQ